MNLTIINSFSHHAKIIISKNGFNLERILPAHFSIRYQFCSNEEYEIFFFNLQNEVLFIKNITLTKNTIVDPNESELPANSIPLEFSVLIALLPITILITLIYNRIKKQKVRKVRI